MNFDQWGGRRWLTSVGLIVIATAMLVLGFITGAQWVELVTWIFGIFTGANVTQRGVEAVKEVKGTPAS